MSTPLVIIPPRQGPKLTTAQKRVRDSYAGVTNGRGTGRKRGPAGEGQAVRPARSIA